MDIFAFTDFRSFLNTHVADVGISLQAWADAMDLGSKSTLAMILNGQRLPGPRVRTAMKKYFAFDKKAAAYFDSLIDYQKKKDEPEAQLVIMERASSLRPEKAFQLLDHAQFSAISQWYYHAIREMVRLNDFREDAEWITERLQFDVKPNQVTQAISDLIKVGLLSRSDQGELVQSVDEATSTDEAASEALKRFHEQSLQNAVDAVRAVAVENRYLSGTTLTINAKNLSAAKNLIRKFEKEFIDLFEEQAGDHTIQLQMGVIPMTKLSPEKDGNHVAH